MTAGQRIEYFASIWVICWQVFFTACGAAATNDPWVGAAYGFTVGVCINLPVWLRKLWQVKQSVLRTTAEHDHSSQHSAI